MGCCQANSGDGVLKTEAVSFEEWEFKNLSLASSPKNRRRGVETFQSNHELETSFVLTLPNLTQMLVRPTRSFSELPKDTSHITQVVITDPTMQSTELERRQSQGINSYPAYHTEQNCSRSEADDISERPLETLEV
jgi:hypothetical protein